jgi:hypothetical protein
MEVNQIVCVKSTDGLPTKWDGGKATILTLNVFHKEGFHKVLCWDMGDTTIFHETQLQPVEEN